MSDQAKTTPEAEVKIGEYLVRPITVPVDLLDGQRIMAPHVWIQHESGEGMSVHENIFTGFIKDLWKDF